MKISIPFCINQEKVQFNKFKTRVCFFPNVPQIRFPHNDILARRFRYHNPGRLYQVEYAMEAISHAGICIGITTPTGVLLIGEKKSTSPLLEHTREKVFVLNESTVCAVAGLTADANLLVA